MKTKHLFTSEAVSEGHPDKVADQISDAILDAYLRKDKNAHVACETLVTTGMVIISGEVNTTEQIDTEDIVRNTISNIGYKDPLLKFDANSCGIINLLHKQSPDIKRGVDRESKEMQGAGDQGIMFGYATNEAPDYMPMAYYIANKLMQTLAYIRKGTELMPYLRPDSKSQVTIEYDGDVPTRIDSILISTQHTEFASDKAMQEQIRKDIIEILLPMTFSFIKDSRVRSLYNGDTKVLVNPTGKFVIGGPHGDTGLTGRKIIVDTYGGYCQHGGGAFSGKDPSKVDRTGAYAARFLAKNIVANNIAKKISIQIGYAIGVPNPVSVYVDGRGYATGWDNDVVSEYIKTLKLTPYSMVENLGLKSPIYQKTAAYGHFGHKDEIKDCIHYFPWEQVINLNDIKI